MKFEYSKIPNVVTNSTLNLGSDFTVLKYSFDSKVEITVIGKNWNYWITYCSTQIDLPVSETGAEMHRLNTRDDISKPQTKPEVIRNVSKILKL